MYKEVEAKDITPATTYSGSRKTTLIASAHLAHEQPLSSRTRDPSNLPSHLLLSLHPGQSVRPLGVADWSSTLIHPFQPAAVTKYHNRLRPSCSSISTWSLIKLGLQLLFVRGTFRPDSLVVEDNTFSKYVPEKFLSKFVQPPAVSEWRPLMSSSGRTIQEWMALGGDLIVR